MKDKTIQDAMGSIENRVRHVYNQGYSDGIADGNINSGLFADKVREAYNNGLDDAWECVRKMERILWSDTLKPIFGEEDYYTLVTKHDAKYCMQKLKDYEQALIDTGTIDEPKQSEKKAEEKAYKSCETCRFANLMLHQFPCSVCRKAYGDRWQPKEGASE